MRFFAKRCRDQSGAALIAALLAAALVSIMAAAIISRQQIDIRRTANIVHGDQAYLFARGVENWVTVLLARYDSGEEREYLGRSLPPMMVEGGQVSGRMDDLQGLFNINNLLFEDTENRGRENPTFPYRDQFKRLLAGCEMDEELVDGVLDWLDDDQELRFPGGAEDREYLFLQPPYRTADRPMVSISELRLVQGFGEEPYDECLKPLLSVLPEATRLNINTAPAELIASLADGIELETAERLVEERPEEGYETVTAFLQEDALAGTEIVEQILDVKSSFYMVQSVAVIGQGQAVLHSLVQRRGDSVLVLRRGRGGL
jgi:general secretion pathway protein K